MPKAGETTGECYLVTKFFFLIVAWHWLDDVGSSILLASKAAPTHVERKSALNFRLLLYTLLFTKGLSLQKRSRAACAMLIW